ncbi:LURP-one-related family protein [Blautia liquoris]|uniref:LURP-one-related family protein n=1 Tax=Blautia liquoris TaxID=2779518 RepID=A0A7M2RJ40_9FIRM|nr:LURP-one-related family protein [Blautia liquoris]QOV19372.1 LURP-one-related family protein [Blautia liquoris]
MKLLIKQRVFSWTDSYDIYDESERVRYLVKAELIALGHRLHIYDANRNEIGMIKQKLLTFLPAFEIEIGGVTRGRIQKKLTFLKPKYEIDCNEWSVEGDFFGWNYDVYSSGRPIIHISKQLLRFGDTYVIDIDNPADELMGMMLVIAIDAANCTEEGM